MKNFFSFPLNLLILVVFFSSSCKNLVYFTASLQDKYGWTKEDIKRIQFYNSEEIILFKDSSQNTVQIKDGIVYDTKGQKIETIIIPKNTPGEVLFFEDGKFATSFTDTTGRYSFFGENPKVLNRYTLYGELWPKGPYGIVNYGGEKWRTPKTCGLSALQLDLRKAKKVKEKVTKLKGRKISN